MGMNEDELQGWDRFVREVTKVGEAGLKKIEPREVMQIKEALEEMKPIGNRSYLDLVYCRFILEWRFEQIAEQYEADVQVVEAQVKTAIVQLRKSPHDRIFHALMLPGASSDVFPGTEPKDSIENLNLPPRIRRVLNNRLDIETIGQLLEMTREEFLELKGAGPVMLRELSKILSEHDHTWPKR